MKFKAYMENSEDPKALWVDDLRPIRKGFNILAKTYEEAIKAIDKYNIVKISLDHDLGEESEMFAYGKKREATGNDVAKYIEMLAREKFLANKKDNKKDKMTRMEWNVHSANPVGEKNIIATMKSAERYWK